MDNFWWMGRFFLGEWDVDRFGEMWISFVRIIYIFYIRNVCLRGGFAVSFLGAGVVKIGVVLGNNFPYF